ncbi:hypothetical protein C8J56DRAFT_1124918 [Mycena floridula]|nr:hypothetical protein C8J56DRAFT_1124918 [Mycena floridula]
MTSRSDISCSQPSSSSEVQPSSSDESRSIQTFGRSKQSRNDTLASSSIAVEQHQLFHKLPKVVRDAQVASPTVIDTTSHESLELGLDRSTNNSIIELDPFDQFDVTSFFALSGADGVTREREEVLAVGEAEETSAMTVQPPQFQSKKQVGVDQLGLVGLFLELDSHNDFPISSPPG